MVRTQIRMVRTQIRMVRTQNRMVRTQIRMVRTQNRIEIRMVRIEIRIEKIELKIEMIIELTIDLSGNRIENRTRESSELVLSTSITGDEFAKRTWPRPQAIRS